MPDHPIPIGPGATAAPPAPVRTPRPPARLSLRQRFAERRLERHNRKLAVGDGRRRSPAVGATTPAPTPRVEVMQTEYQAAVEAIRAGATQQAQPLRLRRAELTEYLALTEHRLAASRARLAEAHGPVVPRDPRPGEEHLTDADLAGRTRHECARRLLSAEIDVRNHETLRAQRRVELETVEERLDAIARTARLRAASARWTALRRLHAYLDELVRHHPDGPLLTELDWPTGFARPPEWVDDEQVARHEIGGPGRRAGGDDAV